MIGVIMRPHYRINLVYAIVEKLVAQIGGRVDQYPGGFALHQNRDPASTVFRFVRVAIAPVVADTGYTRRCPAPQYREF